MKFKLKLWQWALLVLLPIGAVASLFDKPAPQTIKSDAASDKPVAATSTKSAEATSSVQVEAAKTELEKEQAIKDVLFDPGQVVKWQIGVLDDGTNRVGYAMYVCEVLRANKVIETDTQVRVVDIVRVSAGKSFREANLGHVNCSTNEVVSPRVDPKK